MRLKFPAAMAVTLCVTAAGLQAQRQLALVATVSDPGGGELAAIQPEDVRISENGVDAKVLKIDVINRVPKVQVLLDNGLGVPPESLGDLRAGLRGLLAALPPNIEVTLVSTAPQPRFLERATTDREKLLKALDRLTPDTGAGRFVESMYEATDRIDKDKDGNYTIVALATSSGDLNVREGDINKVMQRVQQRNTVAHVVLLATVGRTASGGAVQEELGRAVAGASGGRFEKIAVANRIATLLPEIGAQMGKTLGGGSRQFRFTVERPNGASGDLGKLTMGVAGKIVSNVSVDRSGK
jgi:hypothetical protein